ncbi:MAG: hypothetical protein JST82_00680 [Bacteroidetes bacterium]|nr:hypothetical protein [Bacteroidota bacterium]
MKAYKINATLLFLAMILSVVSCRKKDDPVVTPVETTGEIGFEFFNYAGDSSLVMTTGKYRTGSGDTVSITKFNYYISNVKIKKADGSYFVEDNSYHLVQSDLPSSKHFHIEDVPAGTYTSVTFTIGVDSARNVSGAQTGALDPANGMFWTWNTGYIMAKLEGTSPQSTASGKIFQYHIGGFSGANSALHTVTINFPTNMVLTTGKEGSIIMKADALKWFTPNNISIASKSQIMTVGSDSKAMSDNYANMFSITSISVD